MQVLADRVVGECTIVADVFRPDRVSGRASKAEPFQRWNSYPRGPCKCRTTRQTRPSTNDIEPTRTFGAPMVIAMPRVQSRCWTASVCGNPASSWVYVRTHCPNVASASMSGYAHLYSAFVSPHDCWFVDSVGPIATLLKTIWEPSAPAIQKTGM